MTRLVYAHPLLQLLGLYPDWRPVGSLHNQDSFDLLVLLGMTGKRISTLEEPTHAITPPEKNDRPLDDDLCNWPTPDKAKAK